MDDPASADADAVDLLNAPDFRFTFGDGSGWNGYNVLKVAADGASEFTFLEHARVADADGNLDVKRQWRRAEFKLDPRTIADLRKLLHAIDFWRLKQQYHAPVHDGTQRWTKVEASGKWKGVYCNNNFPEPMERLRAFVEANVLKPHANALQTAQPLPGEPKHEEAFAR